MAQSAIRAYKRMKFSSIVNAISISATHYVTEQRSHHGPIQIIDSFEISGLGLVVCIVSTGSPEHANELAHKIQAATDAAMLEFYGEETKPNVH